MSLGPRDRRALLILGAAAVVWIAADRLWTPSEGPVVPAVDSITGAERRLARLRVLASTVPGRETALKTVSAELREREKGILQADTPAQAQAQLLSAVRRAASALPQPIDFSSTELVQQVSPFGQDYGEVFVSVNFTCSIEELVNFLAELTAQPEAIATRDVRIQPRNTAKDKRISVRLTVSGLVPKRLVPVKRSAF